MLEVREWQLMYPLKSVDEHNEAARKAREEAAEAMSRTGVACPNCGQELRWYGLPVARLNQPFGCIRKARCCSCLLSVELEA